MEASQSLGRTALARAPVTREERNEYFSKADAFLSRQSSPGKDQYVFVNNAAADLIRRVRSVIEGGDPGASDGSAADFTDVSAALRRIHSGTKNIAEVREAAIRVAEVLDEAHRNADHIAVIEYENTPEGIAKTIHHEEFERRVLDLRKQNGDPVVDGDALMRTPEAKRAWQSIGGQYPGKGGRAAAQAIEIAAHLAGGGWDDVGLNRTEARTFMLDFARSLVRTNGRESLAVLARIDPYLRRAVNEEFGTDLRTLGRSSGSVGPTSEARGGTRSDIEGFRPSEKPPIRSKVGQESGAAGEGGAEGRGQPEEGVRRDLSGSLFGEEAARSNAEEVAADRDKLTGERLTPEKRSSGYSALSAAASALTSWELRQRKSLSMRILSQRRNA